MISNSLATRNILEKKLREFNVRFGFDIDDTLINLREHAFHIYNKKLNRNINVDLFHALDKVEIHELFGMTALQGNEMWASSLEGDLLYILPTVPRCRGNTSKTGQRRA